MKIKNLFLFLELALLGCTPQSHLSLQQVAEQTTQCHTLGLAAYVAKWDTDGYGERIAPRKIVCLPPEEMLKP